MKVVEGSFQWQEGVMMLKWVLVAPAMLVIGSTAEARDSLFPRALASPPELTSALKSEPAQSRTLTVPAETEVAVQLLSGIHTRVSHKDDLVKAQILQPVYVKGVVALPAGSWLDGRIIRVRPPRHLNRPAELGLRFERVTLPDGQAEPIVGVLASLEKPAPLKTQLDREGYLRGGSAWGWKKVAGGVFLLGTLTTAKAALAGSAVLGPLLPTGGAAFLGYEMVWVRGNDVHVPPHTRCRIRLTYPITVRVLW